jgi:probable rRNA maturation factor
MQNKQVRFFYQCGKFSFPNRNKLKAFLQRLFKREGKALENLNIIFCTDDGLLEINRRFLQHDYYTDIITFPLSAKNQPIEAELYISIERIKDNAKTGQVSFQSELHRVIFHGCLHLTGYNDKSSQQIKKMREAENRYLRLYFK